ncbi:MAG TPA: acyl-CoA thioesterase [Candidatus Egerieimonas intestinavium]|uniref:Acyl-CoA thioesterase n=1 Tax=Candidatus Egerieimonas intestinavium TaxID=2840777 RepID=A0A9D1JG73_9FIRM|nr:acyl-CoA thioesterase [Candidatus Egerieimonas intestinavium]
MSERAEKRMEDSLTEQVHLIMPPHLNGGGRVFGGMLLQWIDEVAGVVAKRHSGCKNVTTAAIDNLQFKAGIYDGDLVVLIGRVTYTGRTSMEVRVDTYAESGDGMRKPVNRAYFVMVAMDEEDKPTPVPILKVETESQRAEWEGALKRRELRSLRRRDGF